MLFTLPMITLSRMADSDSETPEAVSSRSFAGATECYSLTIFTQRWKEVRDFYVNLLKANVLSERSDRYCEMELGGVPLTLRQCERGETVSYFHLYLTMKQRTAVLNDLRQRGIIVTSVGPYTNFRDPEGRVIKLSEGRTVVS